MGIVAARDLHVERQRLNRGIEHAGKPLRLRWRGAERSALYLETLMGPLEVSEPAPEWIGADISPTWSAETKPLGLLARTDTVREVASSGFRRTVELKIQRICGLRLACTSSYR